MQKTDYLIENEEAIITIDLVFDGQFVTADNSEYSYKVIDNQGNVINEETTVTIPDELPQDKVAIVIEAADNVLNDNSLFEDRYVIVKFLHNGGQVRLRKHLRLIREPYFTASVKDVRNIYGINAGELPDDDLDMTEVYLSMLAALGDSFSEALKSGGRANFRANRALALQAALGIFSSLRLRVAESEKSGTNTFLRNLRNISWDGLKAELENELSGLIEDITGDATLYVDNYSPISLGSRSPDAITGEG
jgi:hypothetical protein